VIGWVAGGVALVLAGLVVGTLLTSEPQKVVAPPVSTAIKEPTPDEVAYPGTFAVLGDRHRLKLELVSLPGMGSELSGELRESEPPRGHSPLFAIGRSDRGEADGLVTVVLQKGSGGARPFTGVKVFDFQPFLQSLSGDLRTLSGGDASPTLSFSDTAAQIDSRTARWVRVRGVEGRPVQLTVTAHDPTVWAARPRPASVVVAWERAPGYRAFDDSQWPGGVDRAVLTEGTPLVVMGAASFAIAFADSFASTGRDSVDVKIERTTAAEPSRTAPDPDAEAQLAAEKLLASARAAIEELDWKTAEELLRKCRVGSDPHPEASALLKVMEQEKGEWTAMLQAEAALDANDLIEAKQKLDLASSSRLLGKRFRLGLSRLSKAADRAGSAKVVPAVLTLTPAVKSEPAAVQPESGVLKPAPVSPDVTLLEEAKRLFKDKQYPAAKTQLQKCVNLKPANYECHKLLGTVWAKLNEPDRGAREYGEFHRLAPPDHPDRDKVKSILDAYGIRDRSATKWLDEARREIDRGAWAVAEPLLLHCLEIEPRNFDCHLDLGTVWSRLYKPKDALRSYKNFLRLAPLSHPNRAEIQMIVDDAEPKKK
jgi:hypothetical protein